MEQKEHIVAEYIIDGVRVEVSDVAFAGKSERELEAIRAEARRIAWGIQLGNQEREQAI